MLTKCKTFDDKRLSVTVFVLLMMLLMLLVLDDAGAASLCSYS